MLLTVLSGSDVNENFTSYRKNIAIDHMTDGGYHQLWGF